MKDWKVHALHILDCIEKLEFINKKGDITSDFVLYDAALRNLQTLCESVAHIPETITNQYSNIPWKSIRGFRNILVHDYLGDIDAITVVKVIDDHLDNLKLVMLEVIKKHK